VNAKDLSSCDVDGAAEESFSLNILTGFVTGITKKRIRTWLKNSN
jgi:hypothetical protein